jgi:hypothetical protein
MLEFITSRREGSCLPVAGPENYIRGNFHERFKGHRRQRCALIPGEYRHEFGMVLRCQH